MNHHHQYHHGRPSPLSNPTSQRPLPYTTTTPSSPYHPPPLHQQPTRSFDNRTSRGSGSRSSRGSAGTTSHISGGRTTKQKQWNRKKLAMIPDEELVELVLFQRQQRQEDHQQQNSKLGINVNGHHESGLVKVIDFTRYEQAFCTCRELGLDPEIFKNATIAGVSGIRYEHPKDILQALSSTSRPMSIKFHLTTAAATKQFRARMSIREPPPQAPQVVPRSRHPPHGNNNNNENNHVVSPRPYGGVFATGGSTLSPTSTHPFDECSETMSPRPHFTGGETMSPNPYGGTGDTSGSNLLSPSRTSSQERRTTTRPPPAPTRVGGYRDTSHEDLLSSCTDLSLSISTISWLDDETASTLPSQASRAPTESCYSSSAASYPSSVHLPRMHAPHHDDMVAPAAPPPTADTNRQFHQRKITRTKHPSLRFPSTQREIYTSSSDLPYQQNHRLAMSPPPPNYPGATTPSSGPRTAPPAAVVESIALREEQVYQRLLDPPAISNNNNEESDCSSSSPQQAASDVLVVALQKAATLLATTASESDRATTEAAADTSLSPNDNNEKDHDDTSSLTFTQIFQVLGIDPNHSGDEASPLRLIVEKFGDHHQGVCLLMDMKQEHYVDMLDHYQLDFVDRIHLNDFRGWFEDCYEPAPPDAKPLFTFEEFRKYRTTRKKTMTSRRQQQQSRISLSSSSVNSSHAATAGLEESTRMAPSQQKGTAMMFQNSATQNCDAVTRHESQPAKSPLPTFRHDPIHVSHTHPAPTTALYRHASAKTIFGSRHSQEEGIPRRRSSNKERTFTPRGWSSLSSPRTVVVQQQDHFPPPTRPSSSASNFRVSGEAQVTPRRPKLPPRPDWS